MEAQTVRTLEWFHVMRKERGSRCGRAESVDVMIANDKDRDCCGEGEVEGGNTYYLCMLEVFYADFFVLMQICFLGLNRTS